MKEVQVAKFQCDGWNFKIVKREDEFRIYNIWNELRDDGIHTHKVLKHRCGSIVEALIILAQYMR